MPQAALPDLNTGYIKYRNEVIASLRAKNYSSCHGSLNSLNALLPEEYRIVIDTIKYNEATKSDITYACNFCTETIKEETYPSEIKKENIEISVLLTSDIEKLVFGNESNNVWICPKCNETNKLSETVISESKLEEPTYLGIVPKPPSRQDGLQGRTKFHTKITQWIWLCLNELEQKMGRYRLEYVGKDDHEGEFGFEGGEEE